MPIVKMPDGVNVRFDDDMTNEQIREIILKKFPDAEQQKIDVSKLSAKDVMSDEDGLNSNPTSKLDLMWTLANLAPDSIAKDQAEQMLVAARAIKNTDYGNLAPEAAKSIGRQTSDLVINRMVGSNIEKIGVLLKDNETKPDDFPKGSVMYYKTQFRDTLANGLIDFGKHVRGLSERLNNSDILKADEGLFEGSFTENPNLHKVADLAMSGVSSLLGLYSVGKYVNPAVSLFLFSGADADDIFWESLESGNSKLKSLGLWGVATAGTAIAEKYGAEKVFGMKFGKEGMTKIVDSAKKTSHKIFEAMIGEGGEEWVQNTFQNLVKKVGYNEAQDIFENGIESFAGGFLGGGLVSSFNYGYQAFKEKSNNAGINEREQEKILNSIAQNIANKPNILETPLQENMKKTYDSFEKMIEKLGDTPEAARLRETKQALDEGYQKYFEQLKEYMPEEQAKGNAALIRSAALFFSDLDGVSVKDWFEQKAPKITRLDNLETKAKEFIDNLTPTKLTIDENEINLFDALKNPDIIKEYKQKDNRKSLLQFIKSRGGVKDVGGDLKAMGLIKQAPGLINNKSGEGLDDIAIAAWENGYFKSPDRPTVNDLLEAIRNESFGNKRYAEEKEQNIADYVDNLAQQLDMLGIDYANMSAQEAERAYNRAVEEYSAQREQAEQNEDFETIPFFQFAGEKAQTAALDELNNAKQLEADGVDNEQIRQQTGWFKGVDGKWRFEIPDGEIRDDFNIDKHREWIDDGDGGQTAIIISPLADIYDNEKLYAAYPELRTMPVQFTSAFREGVLGTSYGGTISLSAGFLSKENPEFVKEKEKLEATPEYQKYSAAYEREPINEDYEGWHKMVDAATDEFFKTDVGKKYHKLMWEHDYPIARNIDGLSKDVKETLVHELQHEIQKIEGFAKGGSSSEYNRKSVLDTLKVMADANADKERFAILEEKIGRKKTENLLRQEKILNDLMKESLEKTGSFSDEVDKENDKYNNLINEYGLSKEEMWDSLVNTPSKKKLEYISQLDAYDIYQRLLGEVEARNVSKRMNMTDEERKAASPESTQDVSNADAIVVFDDGTAMAYQPEAKNEVFYQSAYAGSRVDYDRPSLEAIGSGEGNQAHGWGLYYALNRDVAEEYRRNFTADGNVTYKGKTINDYYDEGDYVTFGALNALIDADLDLEVAIKSMKQVSDINKSSKYYDEDIYKETMSIYEKLKEFNPKDLKETKPKGQVHEVDIPENPYLLDEQKPFSEQSDIVKKGIIDTIKSMNLTEKQKEKFINNIENKRDTGKEIYEELVVAMGTSRGDGLIYSSKENMPLVSKALSENGVKGITYYGRQDGRCFVIFNPDDVKVIQKFYQGENNPLGAYSNRIIYLNRTANASTLPHELAHFWSDELRQSKSLRAKEILKQADKWQESEFERKYSIKEQDGKYIVTDKAGQTVYDKMGEGFETADKAKAYAKEELFARGFEQYLREGKAPNQTLRVVFRNFFNWLKKVYHDMMALDIKLSNPMRNLYAEILGGTKIDTFLSQDVDQFIETRKEVGEERVKQVQDIIDQAIQTPKKTAWQKVKQAYKDFDFSKTWTEIAVPLSTRAKRIAPTFRNTLRRYMFDLLNDRRKNYEELEPMLKKWKEFSAEDSIAFDLALKNNVPEIRDELLNKYDAVEDFQRVKKILEKIYIDAGNAGMDVGYIEDYFPRKVKDVNGLLAYLQGTDEWSNFEEARRKEDPNNKFDAEEQAEFIDKFLRGIVRVDPSAYKYNSEKARKLDTIDNGINQFYEGSMQALINYVDGMTARIAVMKFFGRNDNNVDDSIGAFIGYMLDTNQIKASQVDEVKNILTAVFKSRGVSTKWLKGARDIAYLYTMGGVNTAITQIDDIFVSMYKSGVLNTIQSIKEVNKITKRDIGLDSIAAEFMNGTGTSNAVNWVFKHNGIEFIDGMGKNALLNGVLKKAQKMSDEELRGYLAPVMEEETENTLNDIRAGELSDNVRFFLFNELSDMQPVSLLEMPETYNTGGNRRIFYMLKSFMLKRIDTLRNECFDKIRSDDKAERIEGLKNLYKLTLLMMIGGATKDLLIDFMYGRVIDLKDTVVNNLLGMVGISKYNIYQVREEGLGHTLAIFAFPPLFQVAEDLSGDVNKMIDGKRELKDFEVFKGLPIVGRFYYWWLGGGREKTKKKMRKKR